MHLRRPWARGPLGYKLDRKGTLLEAWSFQEGFRTLTLPQALIVVPGGVGRGV